MPQAVSVFVIMNLERSLRISGLSYILGSFDAQCVSREVPQSHESPDSPCFEAADDEVSFQGMADSEVLNGPSFIAIHYRRAEARLPCVAVKIRMNAEVSASPDIIACEPMALRPTIHKQILYFKRRFLSANP